MKKIFLLSFFALTLITAASANATTVTIATTLPGLPYATSSIGAWVGNFYTFALYIGGILAFGAMVYGGVKYSFGAGNPTLQSEGKDWVQSALLGLLLLASAYVILHTVNPNLTTLADPNVTQVNVPTPAAPNCGTCPTGSSCTGISQGPGYPMEYECLGTDAYGDPNQVYCQTKLNGQCPSGEICTNSGDAINPQYACVSSNPTNYTCGKPSGNYGSCAPLDNGGKPGNCVNSASPTNPPYYACIYD